jgi:hypothetical protein
VGELPQDAGCVPAITAQNPSGIRDLPIPQPVGIDRVTAQALQSLKNGCEPRIAPNQGESQGLWSESGLEIADARRESLILRSLEPGPLAVRSGDDALLPVHRQAGSVDFPEGHLECIVSGGVSPPRGPRMTRRPKVRRSPE